MAAVVDVKFKDLRAAVDALNKAMIGDKKLLEKPIKLVGATKENILKEFLAIVENIPDVDGKFPGPAESLNFYNAIVEAEEKAKKTVTPEEKAAKPKAEKAGKTKKEKAEKGPGVIGTILTLITDKGPITKAAIIDGLVAAFPDREKVRMAKTVAAQLGGSQPTRMEKEKGVKFVITEAGYAIKKQ